MPMWHGRDPSAALSSVHPLLVAVRRDAAPEAQMLSLEVRDLETAALLCSISLGEQPPSPGAPDDVPLFLKIAGSRVVLAQRDDVIVTDLGEDLVRRAPVPLHLKYPRVPVGDVARPLTFRLTAAGGRGERTFALINDEEGLAIDRKTGDVTVDLPRLWKKYLADLSSRKAQEAQNGPSEVALSLLSPEALRSNGETYQRVTRQPLPDRSIATTVSLGVAVTDDAGHQDRFDLYLVATAPLKPIEDILAQRIENTTAPRPAEQPAATPMPAGQAPSSAEAASVAELAKTLRRLEAALDAAIDRLGAIEKTLQERRPQP